MQVNKNAEALFGKDFGSPQQSHRPGLDIGGGVLEG